MIEIRCKAGKEYYEHLIDKIVKGLKIKTLINNPSNEIIVLFSHAKSKSLGNCDGINKRKVKVSIFVEEHKKLYKTKKKYNGELLDTIIHEFVHAKQFLKGELVSLPGCYRYRSKKYPQSLPWEDEASRRAKAVAKRIK